MTLLTQELVQRFAEVGSQDGVHDPLVIAKFFNPTGAGTWYATEWLPEDGVFFGYISIFGDDADEWGYFSLAELEAFRAEYYGLGIERDLHIGERRMSQIDQRAVDRITPGS